MSRCPARWDHVNFDKGEWFIPEENSKTTAWTVPLVPPVRALFHELKGDPKAAFIL